MSICCECILGVHGPADAGPNGGLKQRVFIMRNVLYLLMLGLVVGCQPSAPEPAPQAEPFPNGKLVDLTYAFDEETVFWPTAEGFKLNIDARGMTEAGFYYEANSFFTAEHGGTHLDAPVHFSEGKHAADEIPLDRLMGPVVVVDVSAACAENRDYQIQVSDLEAWEQMHGEMLDDVILLFNTGFGQYWPDREQYMGTAERGAEAVAKLHFPGIHPETATWLVENRNIRAVGLDTPSIDYGQSVLFETHQILFKTNMPAFENVANVDQLPATGATVIALPMKIKDGSGGPLRIVAIVPSSPPQTNNHTPR